MGLDYADEPQEVEIYAPCFSDIHELAMAKFTRKLTVDLP